MPDVRSFKLIGYRSIRDLNAKIERVTVLVGKNGVGKSNLYRGLQLVQAAAQMQLARAIASEGGLSSVEWAGPQAKTLPTGLTLSVVWDDIEYELELGKQAPVPRSRFPQEAFLKREQIFLRTGERRTPLVDRAGPKLKHRGDNGGWQTYPHALAMNEAMISLLREPGKFPEVLTVKNRVDDWRFYHTFRADPDSPLRQKQIVYRTQRLDSDGGNLVAALMSIKEGPEPELLDNLIEMAFPGVGISFIADSNGTRQELALNYKSGRMHRTMAAAELSDGQLRFFALMAALLSRDNPNLMILNEPETSLHPGALSALAEAINHAAHGSQILLVTHSKKLADAIAARRPAKVRRLRWSEERGTRIDDQIRINGE